MEKTIYTYHGDVETTSFFMTQIEKQLVTEGYDVIPLFFDALPKGLFLSGDTGGAEQNPDGRDVLAKAEGAVFLTFNFAGIYSKDAYLLGDLLPTEGAGNNGDGAGMLVDAYDMKVINIIVDHPYHYHDFLYEQQEKRRDRYFQFCIDREHVKYMERYFPDINCAGFLPSAGTVFSIASSEDEIPFDRRRFGILFAGTYVEPDWFNVFIERNGPEYAAFYRTMTDEALADPFARLEDIVRRRLEEEIEEGVSEDEIRLTLGHIQFLDYYVRYKRRGEVIRTLTDGEGLDITIAGSGWEEFRESLDHPERITLLEHTDSEGILSLLSETKISLNILPSFHDGAHDRIFNSMLCGCVCATDSNPYLDEILADNENALLYKTPPIVNGRISKEGKKICAELAGRIKETLDGKDGEDMLGEDAHAIAEAGKNLAASHTWASRAETIMQFIKNGS
ncbi:MAG: glycosyltransferase family 1 protein [Lachnospiraceae bacterium]|nr:glycosyltransferase family 1 protein [Lachnospiraceae bacterium]